MTVSPSRAREAEKNCRTQPRLRKKTLVLSMLVRKRKGRPSPQ